MPKIVFLNFFMHIAAVWSEKKYEKKLLNAGASKKQFLERTFGLLYLKRRRFRGFMLDGAPRCGFVEVLYFIKNGRRFCVPATVFEG